MQSIDLSAKELVRYLKIVQETGSFEILILRTHLLVEEELRVLISKGLPHPQHFDQRGLSFSQSLMLAQSLHWKSENDWVWECLKLLNTIRNSLAHKLLNDIEPLDDKLNRLDLLIGKHSNVPMPKELAPSVQRLQWRLASLYSVISSL